MQKGQGEKIIQVWSKAFVSECSEFRKRKWSKNKEFRHMEFQISVAHPSGVGPGIKETFLRILLDKLFLADRWKELYSYSYCVVMAQVILMSYHLSSQALTECPLCPAQCTSSRYTKVKKTWYCPQSSSHYLGELKTTCVIFFGLHTRGPASRLGIIVSVPQQMYL